MWTPSVTPPDNNLYLTQIPHRSCLSGDPASFTSENWEHLFHYINQHKVTPFLGAGIAREHFGSGDELAKTISDKFGYPFQDTFNLAKVAQFAEIKTRDALFVRTFVAEYITEKRLPDFNNPLEPHQILAKLDLPIYITTNYDHLMFEALKNDGKNPIIESCRWNESGWVRGKPSVFDRAEIPKFDSKNPLVYHIHGEVDNPQLMVLTEDDYLNFLLRLYLDIDKLFPSQIREALSTSSIIFIGYSFSDWNLRIILRKIATAINSLVPLHISIQLAPTEITDKSENERNEIREYLTKYLEAIQKVNLRIFWGDAFDFCNRLAEQGKRLKTKSGIHAS
jgi:ribosomal protein S17E